MFYLATDASEVGLGAVLFKFDEDISISYFNASRNLRPSERNFPSFELKC